MALIGVEDPVRLGIPADIIAAIEEYYAPKQVFYLFSDRLLDRGVVETLYCEQNTLFGRDSGDKSGELVVILDSPGGDIAAAYLIVRFLRAHCDRLTVVVPRWAKSAATLVCLGADTLVMTDVAELGPLDPQIRRAGETGPRPVLDEYMALDALRKDVINSINLTMPLVIGGTGMDVKDLLVPVFTFVANLMAPVYSRVDPFVIAAHMRSVEISKEYAIRVLSQRSRNPESDEALRVFERFADQLASGYPCHDFVVDIAELRRLGYPVRRASGREEQVLRPLVRFSQRVELIGTWEGVEAAKPQVAAVAEPDVNVGDADENEISEGDNYD